MICPNCSKENKNTNIRCEFCGAKLIDIDERPTKKIVVKESEVSSKKIGCITNIIVLSLLIPLIITGISFFIIGITSDIYMNGETRGYKSTIATLKEYRDCIPSNEGESCKALYEYKVNGNTYSVLSQLTGSRKKFQKKEKVYYDPNNPSSALLYVKKNKMTTTGLILISIVIILFIITQVILKKLLKNKDSISMKVYTRK